MKSNRLAVAFDFDGVVHDLFDGWRDGTIYGSPNEDVIDAMKELVKMKIPVFIFSTRSPFQIEEWFNRKDFGMKSKVIPSDVFFFNDLDYIGVTNKKLPASLYIDDRAVTYKGQDKKEILLLAIGKENEKSV